MILRLNVLCLFAVLFSLSAATLGQDALLERETTGGAIGAALGEYTMEVIQDGEAFKREIPTLEDQMRPPFPSDTAEMLNERARLEVLKKPQYMALLVC